MNYDNRVVVLAIISLSMDSEPSPIHATPPSYKRHRTSSDSSKSYALFLSQKRDETMSDGIQNTSNVEANTNKTQGEAVKRRSRDSAKKSLKRQPSESSDYFKGENIIKAHSEGLTGQSEGATTTMLVQGVKRYRGGIKKVNADNGKEPLAPPKKGRPFSKQPIDEALKSFPQRVFYAPCIDVYIYY